MNIVGILASKATALTAIDFISLTNSTNVKLRTTLAQHIQEEDVLLVNLLIIFMLVFATPMPKDVLIKKISKHAWHVNQVIILTLAFVHHQSPN